MGEGREEEGETMLSKGEELRTLWAFGQKKQLLLFPENHI